MIRPIKFLLLTKEMRKQSSQDNRKLTAKDFHVKQLPILQADVIAIQIDEACYDVIKFPGGTENPMCNKQGLTEKLLAASLIIANEKQESRPVTKYEDVVVHGDQQEVLLDHGVDWNGVYIDLGKLAQESPSFAFRLALERVHTTVKAAMNKQQGYINKLFLKKYKGDGDTDA